ncbi:hypothetical protein [uncultured Prevotella sp.]|uniref:hypothetical protein n=1 Tax=uncultured Prevotella sp. TaxID=159272 RepID=UPI0025E75620|nr:hypothetical protein [uncultured Prevotella sp.]
MKKEEYIKQLLDKYLDGETSSAEERALRGYFTNKGNNIPEEWMPYRALFTYIAEERADEGETAETIDINVNKAVKAHRRGWIYAAATAAAAILIAVVMISLPRQNDNYAVIDGKVYTNKKVVEDEALKALQMVSSDNDDNFDALKMMRQ